MPKCKYCKENITKFDKDICPYCGGKNPIDETLEQTVDLTQSILTVDAQDEVRVNFKAKSKAINALLCMFFGVIGLDELYIGKKIKFLIRFIINAIAYIALCLIFTIDKFNIDGKWVFLIPLLILFVVYFFTGIIFLFLKNRKDSNGAFLI